MTNLLCPWHLQSIIQIDVDPKTPSAQRPVCLDCPSKTRESIKRALQIYKELTIPKLNRINQLKTLLQTTQKESKKRISQIQEQIKIEIDQLNAKIDKEHQNIINELLEYEKELQIDEDKISLTKLQSIAQIVVESLNNQLQSSPFQEEHDKIINSIKLLKQEVINQLDETQVKLNAHFNSIIDYIETQSKKTVIQEIGDQIQITKQIQPKQQIQHKQQIIYQLDQNYEACAFNDKLLLLANKNQKQIQVYQLDVQNRQYQFDLSFNDPICLFLNQQQLIVRSSQNEISINQIENEFAQRQIIPCNEKEQGYNSCMVLSENNQFLIYAQPQPIIMIFIKKEQSDQQWSKHQALEGFGWPVQDLSFHQETMNIVICTHNKDIYIWKKEVTKFNQIKWVLMGEPIKKAHNDRIYSVCWIKSDQFISGGLDILNWKQNKNGEFEIIEKIEKLHTIERLSFLRFTNLLFVQESGNCIDLYYINDKNKLEKQDSMKGNFKILSIQQQLSAIAINNLDTIQLQILKFFY